MPFGGVSRQKTASKKKRSVFWVVLTHVLTTGFAMPTVTGMAGAPIAAIYPSALSGFLLALGFQALGYIGGVYYSLSYLRKAALIEHPLACLKPSIITFTVLAVSWLRGQRGVAFRPTGEADEPDHRHCRSGCLLHRDFIRIRQDYPTWFSHDGRPNGRTFKRGRHATMRIVTRPLLVLRRIALIAPAWQFWRAFR